LFRFSEVDLDENGRKEAIITTNKSIDEMIRKKVRLEEELVKIKYLKSLGEVRRQGRELLLSLNHQ